MSKSWDEEAFLNFHIHWKKEEKKKRILGISLWGSLRERKTSSLVLGRAFLLLACAAEIQGPTLARFVSSVAASLYQVLLVLTVCSPCSACVNWWYWLTTSSKLHCLKCNGDHLCIIYLKKKYIIMPLSYISTCSEPEVHTKTWEYTRYFRFTNF